MPVCAGCGQENSVDRVDCVTCGADLRVRRKGMAIASLVLGILAIPTLGLMVVGGLGAIILGIVALIRANRQPLMYGGKGLAIGGIVAGTVSLCLIPVIGILAALAIPALSRAAASANEVSAMAQLRTIASAEAILAASNGGAYDTIDCLARPASCGFGPEVGMPFLDPAQRVDAKSGYRFSFVKGEAVDRSSNAGIRSTSPIDGFAVVAEPERPGQTGTKVLCVDATFVIRVAPDGGGAGSVSGGVCPASWAPLQ